MSAALRQAGALGIGFALIVISAGLGVFYIASAANAWLSTEMAPGWAMLIIGGALALPLIVFAIVMWLKSRGQRAAATHDAISAAQIEVHEPESMSRLALRIAGDLFKQRPLATVSLALGVAALVARYPGAAALVARKLIAHR